MSTENIPGSDAFLGCVYGLMCGDTLGGSVEFMDSNAIKNLFPTGVREMINGQGHSPMVTARKPGNITDDSEMALALMQGLLTTGHCDGKAIHTEYLKWVNMLKIQKPTAA